MEFDNTSQQIWEEMQAGTPFANPKKGEEEDYEESFNDESTGIDFEKLITYIKQSKKDGRSLFNREVYLRSTKVSYNNAQLYLIPDHKPFKYEIAENVKKQTEFSGQLNKRIDHVSPVLGYWMVLDPQKEEVYGRLHVYYANTNLNKIPNPKTESPNDYTIEDKYSAIILKTSKIEDFYRLYCDINSGETFNIRWVEEWIINKFLSCLKRYKSAKALNFIYKSIPEFAFEKLASQLSNELLTTHLYILKGFDEKNWFKDNSGSMINLLRVLCNGDSAYLYRLLRNHPILTMDAYSNMDDTSEIANEVHTNKSIFVNLIHALCLQNSFEGLTKKDDTYHIGKDYFQKIHNPVNHNGVIFLQQARHVVFSRDPKTGKPTGEAYPQDLSAGQYYDPMDLVKLIDEDSIDRTPVWVPVIVIKAMADEQVRASNEERLRLGLDVLGIVMGVATLGAGTPFALTVGLLDIGLSLADMFVVLHEDELMKSEEGRAFLDLWGKIQILGVAVAGPALLGTAFTSGARLFSRAALVGARAETKNFLRAALTKIILERNIIFFKGSFTILETGKEVFVQSRQVFKILQITELQKANVVFARLERTADGKVVENGFAVFYKGEVLAMGEAKKVREALKDVWGLKGVKLTAKLEEFYDLVHIDTKALEHSDIGNFALPGNPKKSKLPGKMLGGGHGQANINELIRLNREFEIIHTYKNGVRIGNIKLILGRIKNKGTGQSWFPKDWDSEKIRRAGQFVIQNNVAEFKKTSNGRPVFATFENVRVGVIKTNNRPATIFPDNSKQPIPKTNKIEHNPIKND